MTKNVIPENISTAINAMLEPYGLDMAKLQPHAMPEDDGKRYLSICDAMKYCSISRWTLGRAIKAGQLPALKLSDAKAGKVLIDRSDLDKWLRRHRIKAVLEV